MSGDLKFLGRSIELPAQVELTAWTKRLGPGTKKIQATRVFLITTSAQVALCLEDEEGRKLELSFGSPGRAEILLAALFEACREGASASLKELQRSLKDSSCAPS